MKIKLHSQIEDIQPDQWNSLLPGNYPFLRHEFLCALERHRCVGEHAGWIPRHIACYDDDDCLVGAMPLYEKHNSWGEFVFDYAWADAYHRAGLQYYPKLVNAVPFTPATGPRFVAKESRAEVASKLLSAARQIMHQGDFSGIHSLFVTQQDFDLLNHEGALTRIDCQFHWHNKNYENFDQFLSTLKSKKRKNIKQERRKVQDSGVNIRALNGHQASEQDWRDFARLYRKIYDRKYGAPAFNLGFFVEVASSLPDQVLLVLVDDGIQSVAGALMYADDETLYGRHWGCQGYVDSLHFEVCYYQGIDYCLRKGLKRFDPGAQGEHKIARGFIPTETRSLHWIAGRPFQQAIAEFVEREQSGVRGYMRAVQAHSPYQQSI
ncbi:MAG: GNAT family N-acetyltransferase [bacterium]